MANKFILYRKNKRGGIVSDGVTKDNSGVVGVYDQASDAPQNVDDQWHEHVLIEYDYDPTVDTTFNLRLNAAGTGFDKKWTGKTIAEQLQAHHDEQTEIRYKEKKARLSKAINVAANERIERKEGWRIERAKQQDFLAGNTAQQTALYTEIEAVRSSSNTKQAELSAIDETTDAGKSALDSFDAYDFGGGGANPHGVEGDGWLKEVQAYDHTKA
tara:strand:- start:50 stop:691 length:642 start_codon:yes stop_codon:yes gene_type:complete